jgi:hypothetical protein
LFLHWDPDRHLKPTKKLPLLSTTDFSQNAPSDAGRPGQGTVRGNVYDPDAELQQRLAGSQSWFSIDAYSPYFDVVCIPFFEESLFFKNVQFKANSSSCSDTICIVFVEKQITPGN